MEYNESQWDVTPDPQESELRSQNAEEMAVDTEPVKNIMAALGLISSLSMSTEKSQEEMLAALDAPERAQRIAVVQAIGQQSEVALVVLQKALEHDDEVVRATAVNMLGILKERAPLELLLKSLHDPAWYVRGCAAHALGEQIERAPLVPLIEAMHDEDESVRAEAVWALGMLKEYAPEVLLDMLHDPARLVREAAELVMKERIEQAIYNAPSIEQEELVGLALPGQEEIVLPMKSLLERKKLPDTGPLAVHAVMAEVDESEFRGDELAGESQRWRVEEEEVDRYERISILSAQRSVGRRESKSGIRRRQRKSILEKILVAVLILGLGAGWYSLDQRFHQSSSASQGSLSCVFHPGINGNGDVIAWSPDKASDALFAVAGGGGRVEVYQAGSCRHMAEYRQENGSVVLAMKWIVEGLRMAMLTANGHIVVIQENEKPEYLLNIVAGTKVHAAHPLVAWSDDGQHIAVNWGDDVVQVWSIAEKGTLLATYKGSYGPISALALSPYGTDLAAAAFDPASLSGTVDIWSVTSRVPVVSQSVYASAKVVAMAWSEDGENLLYYDQSNLVREWSQQLGSNSLSTTEYVHMQQADNTSLALAWAADNTRFVISTSDDMQLWNAGLDSLLVAIPNNFAQIDKLAWSMDGRYIVAAGIDGAVQLWSVIQAQPTGTQG